MFLFICWFNVIGPISHMSERGEHLRIFWHRIGTPKCLKKPISMSFWLASLQTGSKLLFLTDANRKVVLSHSALQVTRVFITSFDRFTPAVYLCLTFSQSDSAADSSMRENQTTGNDGDKDAFVFLPSRASLHLTDHAQLTGFRPRHKHL